MDKFFHEKNQQFSPRLCNRGRQKLRRRRSRVGVQGRNRRHDYTRRVPDSGSDTSLSPGPARTAPQQPHATQPVPMLPCRAPVPVRPWRCSAPPRAHGQAPARAVRPIRFIPVARELQACYLPDVQMRVLYVSGTVVASNYIGLAHSAQTDLTTAYLATFLVDSQLNNAHMLSTAKGSTNRMQAGFLNGKHAHFGSGLGAEGKIEKNKMQFLCYPVEQRRKVKHCTSARSTTRMLSIGSTSPARPPAAAAATIEFPLPQRAMPVRAARAGRARPATCAGAAAQE